MKKPSSFSKIVSLFFIIGRRMRDESHKKVPRRYASLLHFETLRYVRDHKKPLMRDVAKHFLITPPAATLLIDGLVKERFLMRMVDARDRRAVRVMLTQRGKVLLARGIKEKIAALKSSFSVLSAKERVQLEHILEKVARNI